MTPLAGRQPLTPCRPCRLARQAQQQLALDAFRGVCAGKVAASLSQLALPYTLTWATMVSLKKGPAISAATPKGGEELPGVPAPLLAGPDLAGLRFAVANGVDIVAAPFVRSGEDVQVVRRVLADLGGGAIQVGGLCVCVWGGGGAGRAALGHSMLPGGAGCAALGLQAPLC
jgi:hypothetical protein